MDARVWLEGLEGLEMSGRVKIREALVTPGESGRYLVRRFWPGKLGGGGIESTFPLLPIQKQESGTARLAGAFGNVYQ